MAEAFQQELLLKGGAGGVQLREAEQVQSEDVNAPLRVQLRAVRCVNINICIPSKR